MINNLSTCKALVTLWRALPGFVQVQLPSSKLGHWFVNKVCVANMKLYLANKGGI